MGASADRGTKLSVTCFIKDCFICTVTAVGAIALCRTGWGRFFGQVVVATDRVCQYGRSHKTAQADQGHQTEHANGAKTGLQLRHGKGTDGCAELGAGCSEATC